jgi:hypothetical protein
MGSDGEGCATEDFAPFALVSDSCGAHHAGHIKEIGEAGEAVPRR